MCDNKTYIAIDLKSFYASVECMNRNLDPLKTNLVVADESRTDKTICLAVSPSLKSIGIPGRPRLFEAKSKIKEFNNERLRNNNLMAFRKISNDIDEINQNVDVGVDFIVAEPRMSFYIDASTKIYQIYLKWIAPEDIHVYSIDEVFIDATNYLKLYNMSGKELASHMIKDVLESTGVTATAGVGSNMYLCKIAMDILAKHQKPDKHGVRIAELDEFSYKRELWGHTPITDFWRVGKGYADRLRKFGLYTMGDVARFSIDHEDLLYKEFGVNAELLIDHAWGYEPCTISDVKKYRPTSTSKNSGQVLHEPYNFSNARVVVHEMAESLALDLFSKNLFTNQITLTIGYDRLSLEDKEINYNGEIKIDSYGRAVPKKSHGVCNLERYTNSSMMIIKAVLEIFDSVVNKELYIRRINICSNNLCYQDQIPKCGGYQFDMFTESNTQINEQIKQEYYLKKEKNIQKAILNIKSKYGNNSILIGTNLREGATGIDRNNQIGGHKS